MLYKYYFTNFLLVLLGLLVETVWCYSERKKISSLKLARSLTCTQSVNEIARGYSIGKQRFFFVWIGLYTFLKNNANTIIVH